MSIGACFFAVILGVYTINKISNDAPHHDIMLDAPLNESSQPKQPKKITAAVADVKPEKQIQSQMYEESVVQPITPFPKVYNYEGDWCIEDVDLSDADKARAEEDRFAYMLSRGHMRLTQVNEKQPSRAELAEFVNTYRDMPLSQLKQLAQQDDQNALIALVQRSDAALEDRSKAGKKLLLLGNTNYGLERILMDHLNYAGFIYNRTGTANQLVKKHLIYALALVEYGLQRLDTSGLEVYLMYVKEHSLGDYSVNPDMVLSEEDLATVPNITNALWNKVEKARKRNHLPPLANETIPPIAKKLFDRDLALAYSMYSSEMNGSSIMNQWSGSYLEKNTCVDRISAFYLWDIIDLQ